MDGVPHHQRHLHDDERDSDRQQNWDIVEFTGLFSEIPPNQIGNSGVDRPPGLARAPYRLRIELDLRSPLRELRPHVGRRRIPRLIKDGDLCVDLPSRRST